MNNSLYLVAFNLTRRCNLACAHCYLDAGQRLQPAAGELDLDTICPIIDQVADHSPGAMVVLTGGEPLLRQDLEEIVGHATGQGLAVVVGTNGLLLDQKRAAALQAAGLLGAGISLDALDPEGHDRFRGKSGAWQGAMEAIDACRQCGLPFQIHFSIGPHNHRQLEGMVDFARSVGAVVLNLFFLVCVGRGEAMTGLEPELMEQLLERIIALEASTPGLLVRARCAPQYKSIAHRLHPERPLTRATGYEGGGCLAGRHYARITAEGDLTACPYIESVEGSLLEQPFARLWQESPRLQQLRALWSGEADYGGRCGICEYRLLCGGCRARPLAAGGELHDSDPTCRHEPSAGQLIRPMEQHEGLLEWSTEAKRRLERVPPFLRSRVERRAEELARNSGEQRVEIDHLEQLVRLRFDGHPPWHRPASAGDG